MKFNYANMLFYTLKRHFLAFLYISFLLISCNKEKGPSSQLVNEVKVIPKPYKFLYKRGYFTLTTKTRLLLNLSNDQEIEIANYFLKLLKEKTGHKLKIADRFTTNKIENRIELIYEPNLKENGYNLYVSGSSVKIEFRDKPGAAYAFETLVEIMAKNNGKWLIPQLSIEDKPYLPFRAIYLNTPVKIDSILVEQLVRHKFNFLILPDSTNNLIQSEYIHILSRNKIDSGNLEYIRLSPTNFYKRVNNPNNEFVFEINDGKLLSGDSLSILEEAMWSRPDVRNILKLKELLTELTP